MSCYEMRFFVPGDFSAGKFCLASLIFFGTELVGPFSLPHVAFRFRFATDRSKIRTMAGCLPSTKRFRHGRPDRGRC
jgi:hypothetical protein